MPVDNASSSTVQPLGDARFHRCALKVNPHHYAQTRRGHDAQDDGFTHAQKIVDEAVRRGIEVLAITDHNNLDGVADFQLASLNCPVHIFLGLELRSSERIHLLCLYSPDTGDDRLGRYLGERGIRDTNPSAQTATKSFAEILQMVESQGGITIAAHVTNNGGPFKVLSGQSGIRAWRDRNLLAVQTPGVIGDIPQDIRQVVENRNVDHSRVHALEDGISIAALNASDIVRPEHIDGPSATCRIKRQEVTIDGLRQAFRDPGSCVRLNANEGKSEPDEHMEMVSVGWDGGFLDGVVVHLNPNLNVLVGGRGTGRSTVSESTRSALDPEPVGCEARKAHDGIVRQVPRNGTKISLAVRVHSPRTCEYRIERTIPNPPLVRDANGTIPHNAPKDVFPRVEACGQHEIYKYARSREKPTRLLDRFVARDRSLERRRAVGRREAESGRVRVAPEHTESVDSPSVRELVEEISESGREAFEIRLRKYGF